MNEIIKDPNLPQHKVNTVVCQKQAAVYLQAHNIRTLSPVADNFLPPETAQHADMLFCQTAQNSAVVAPSQVALANELNDLGFSTLFSEPLGHSYPQDIKLNCAIVGSYALCNKLYTDAALLRQLNMADKTIISVKQGYTKCNLCIVQEDAFITEDLGLYKQLTALGSDVLLIHAGDIFLSANHYGFLGGASGKISENTLAIFGSLLYHRDKDNIIRFLHKHGVTPLCLCDRPITDIGGILPITEER